MKVCLINTYDLGHQPFGIASPARWLEDEGANVKCLDLSVECIDEDAVKFAGLIAIYLPMHTATRLAIEVLPKINNLNSDMEARRDHLALGLSNIGFEVIPCEGTYFLTADYRPVGFDGTDLEFCRFLTVEARVAAVPMSAFYTGNIESHFVRLSFCKNSETIEEAIQRLKKHFGKK